MEYEAIGTSIEIHGIQASRFGRSCEWHDTCGDTVCIDALVRVKWTQIEYGKWIFHDILFCVLADSDTIISFCRC